MKRCHLSAMVLFIGLSTFASPMLAGAFDDERTFTRDEQRAAERAKDETSTPADDSVETDGDEAATRPQDPTRRGQSGRPPDPRGTLEAVCHKPGTPAQRTLYVNIAAYRAHLRHGDTPGVCPGDESPSDPAS